MQEFEAKSNCIVGKSVADDTRLKGGFGADNLQRFYFHKFGFGTIYCILH
jgi:hypothetical protein